MASVAISLENKIANLKQNFTPDGFYVQKDAQLLFVRLIQHANDPLLFEKFENYGIEFILAEDGEPQVDGIVWSEEEEMVEGGLETLALGYSEKAQEVQSSIGPILEVNDSESPLTFTIQTEPHFASDFYPVFLLDRIDSAVRFTGIFSPKEQKVVHLTGFCEETRGKGKPQDTQKIPFVHIRNSGEKVTYYGSEIERNGKRSVVITGPGVNVKYNLKYQVDQKLLNPHEDKKNYNKGGQRTLYETALINFVLHYEAQNQIPAEYPFQCYKNSEYVATLE